MVGKNINSSYSPVSNHQICSYCGAKFDKFWPRLRFKNYMKRKSCPLLFQQLYLLLHSLSFILEIDNMPLRMRMLGFNEDMPLQLASILVTIKFMMLALFTFRFMLFAIYSPSQQEASLECTLLCKVRCGGIPHNNLPLNFFILSIFTLL